VYPGCNLGTICKRTLSWIAWSRRQRGSCSGSVFPYSGAIVYRSGHQVFILRSGVRFPVALPSFCGIGCNGVLGSPNHNDVVFLRWFESNMLPKFWCVHIMVIILDCLSRDGSSILPRIAKFLAVSHMARDIETHESNIRKGKGYIKISTTTDTVSLNSVFPESRVNAYS
jgi:hypothetical protein